jgi:GTP cyclohydrolase I
VSAVAHSLPDQPTAPGHRRRLQILDRSPVVDLARAERAVADLLAALGQDPSDEQLLDTPRRVAASYTELLTPPPFTLTTFPNDEGYDELVLARAIPFSSLCQHHLLPFTGVAHVGIAVLSVVIGLLVSVGATFGGSLVYDYGFNVETAGDHPVWHRSETDEFAGQHDRREER